MALLPKMTYYLTHPLGLQSQLYAFFVVFSRPSEEHCNTHVCVAVCCTFRRGPQRPCTSCSTAEDAVGRQGLETFFEAPYCNTHCSTLQHTATHCNTLQHRRRSGDLFEATHCTTRCNTLQHAAAQGRVLRPFSAATPTG